jgi:hypothetical protein
LVAVRRIAEQPFDRFLGQNAAIEQRVENRVVERLHRFLVFVGAVGIAEAARQQQIRQLRHEVLEIEIVEVVAGELRVPVPRH